MSIDIPVSVPVYTLGLVDMSVDIPVSVPVYTLGLMELANDEVFRVKKIKISRKV